MLATLGLLANTDPATASTFDEATELAVRHFQQRRGISVDGRVGPDTFAALTGAHWKLGDRVLSHEPARLLIGDDVADLQSQLIELGYPLARDDGVFEATTAEALRSFQREYGLVPDSICGPGTLLALKQLARRVVGGRPQMLREMATVAASGPSLLGKRIVLDPGHGGADRGVEVDGVAEADLMWELASRIEGRLVALGVRTLQTRGPNVGKTDEERALFANEVGADLVVSLHVDGAPSARANGVATYHYGTDKSSSIVGERLAGLAQRELVARTGLTDNRVHPKAWTMLRLTRMPIVRVELGYLTSPRDRAMLLDPRFQATVAESLLVSIQRLYLPTAEDPPTGVMRIPSHAG